VNIHAPKKGFIICEEKNASNEKENNTTEISASFSKFDRKRRQKKFIKKQKI
jgi:hypothetical protein